MLGRVRKLTIAIDGPAGSGKSSVARRVAARLGYLYLDSGAMYRALALKSLEAGTPLEDENKIESLARETRIELRPPAPGQAGADAGNLVFLDGRDVTARIRTTEVAQAASRVATVAGVRSLLVALQQRAGANGGVVMEGRDIGTVVFPLAELKIFLDASPEARAERRWEEHREKGDNLTIADVLEEVKERDKRDRLDGREGTQYLSQDTNAAEYVRREKEFVLAGAGALNDDGREDALIGEAPVEIDFHVAGALELFEDD